jgi:peptidoglycan/xylan/chitin deacetylase (PgdA/CDA1 family)
MVIASDTFRAHAEFLAERCEVMEVERALAAPLQRDRPRVAITFDDGYRCLLEHALPVLAEYELPSTVFCCADVVSGRRALWWDLLERAIRAAPEGDVVLRSGSGTSLELRLGDESSRARAHLALFQHCSEAREPLTEAELLLSQLPSVAFPAGLYMHVPELRQAIELGASIGSHGCSHARLSALGSPVLAAELRDSRSYLEEVVGRPSVSVAYPYGDPPSVGRRVVEAARAAGYKVGLAIRPDLARPCTELLDVPRVPVFRRDTTRRLAGKAVGPHPLLYRWMWEKVAA